MLYRMASNKGVSPWPYILNYTGLALLLAVAVATFIIQLGGPEMFKGDWFNNPEARQIMMMGLPFTLLFELLLFLYFRKQIDKVVVEDEEEIHPTPPEKKDLSYFR